MGFGYMFLGYILLLRTNVEFFGIPLDITPDVLGLLLMSYGFSVASKHCKCFDLTKLLGKVGVVLSFAVFTLDVFSALKLITLSAVATKAVAWGYTLFLAFFTLSTLRSVYRISEETGVERLKKRATRQMFVTVLFIFIEQGLSDILPLFGIVVPEESMKYVTGAMVLAGAAYVLLNAALIFSCYMWICLEGDEDMPDNRKHKYKTPFDYYEKGRSSDGKKKKRK